MSASFDVKSLFPNGGVVLSTKVHYTNDEFIRKFIQYEQCVDRSVWTQKSLKYTLNRFFSENLKNAIEIDCDDLQKFFLYLKKRKGRGGNALHSESIRKHINNLSSFYNWMVMEEHIHHSPVKLFRWKFMRPYLKSHQSRSNTRQLISLTEMRELISSALDQRDKAIMLTLAKTGVRAGELLSMEVNDVNFRDFSIKLKENNKRTNLLVFFDKETSKVLKKWLRIREMTVENGSQMLFTTRYGRGMSHNTLNNIIKKYAKMVGLHNPDDSNLEGRFTAHCYRHFFTSTLRKAGMPREFVMELRGDKRGDTMDIYYHISTSELREAYLRYMPSFGL